jgi:transcriptional regulator with XRE-family HTH domain
VDAFVIAFGAHIRSVRHKLGLSQEEVAHRAGIHVTYLSGIERGRRNPSLKNIRRVALALNVPVGELLAFDEPAP